MYTHFHLPFCRIPRIGHTKQQAFSVAIGIITPRLGKYVSSKIPPTDDIYREEETVYAEVHLKCA